MPQQSQLRTSSDVSRCRSSWILAGDVSGQRRPSHGNRVRWHPGERLHHLFEQRTDQFLRQNDSGHLAVDAAGGRLTYKSLDERANRLARYLKVRGMGAGDIIGLLFDKSADSYAAMLAVSKIHAAYVPLDGTFPADRIAYIAKDAGATSILTVSQYQALTRAAGRPAICVDMISAEIDRLASHRLDSSETGKPVSELSYIIYTSGSTGRPKGVPIDQAGICNFVRVAAEVYGYHSSDRVYQGLTLAFDFAVEEIWVPLAVGATLLPNQTGSSLLGSELARFLSDNGATAMCCVPTLLATIAEDLPDLRLLIVSGEACPQDLIRRWHTAGRTILNAYGPTETTVTATLAHLSPDEPVTIGKPLPTYSVVILEPGSENVLPFGQEGEIAIAGVGVAGGYLNREEQTRKAFIKDFLVIENNPSGLIYRTGDLGRINADGNIEYRGRIDLQVKIRGYRIELTEIESVMMQLPQIAQAVVNTFEPLPGAKELVAYYTLKADGEALKQDELLVELRGRLPNYMVPAYYEELAEIPLMASDKADRKKLPPPSGRRMHGHQRKFVPPRGESEVKIAAVLARQLGLDAVSVEDDFFADLGANSLLMANFSAELRRSLGIAELSMREIYAHPTIRKLAALHESSGKTRRLLKRETTIHKAKARHMFLTGAAQLLTGYLLLYFAVGVFWQGYVWVLNASGEHDTFYRSVQFSVGLLALSVLLPVALKWTVIGRFKPEVFPVYSLRYFIFWLVKSAINLNPMRVFVGTPIFIAYLKLLGARVSWQCNIQSGHIPVTTDMFYVAPGAVISQNVVINGYRAESGRIRTGWVAIGQHAFIGPASVVDIYTQMATGSELAHSSSLHEEQFLEAWRSYHGSPAQPTQYRYRQLEGGDIGLGRQIFYSLLILVPVIFALPMLFLLVHGHRQGIFGAFDIRQLYPLLHLSVENLTTIFVWSLGSFAGMVAAGLVAMALGSRLIHIFLTTEDIYSLYGIHYLMHGVIKALSNSVFYNYLFGDSSYIVYFLRWIGYRFKGIVQTGSNFGLEQRHENSLLCDIGRGTMVSDGLAVFNTTYSCSKFKLSNVNIGANSFLGNDLVFPPGSKVEKNCLLATKAMVPTHGPVWENTGLLGSPCFEIPRSVQQDKKFDHFKKPEVLRKRLKLKNVHNLVTMGLFLLINFVPIFFVISLCWFSHPLFVAHGSMYAATLLFALPYGLMIYYILIERASLLFRRLKPRYCSIYDEYYWTHERFWKLSAYSNMIMKALNGTPLKSLAWRARGVKVGKRLFDDGAGCWEPTLLTIGDFCTLNSHCFLQPHSLEEGTFKSDFIHVGNRCTVGINAFVHYGTVLEDGVTVESDAFLMKGERPGADSIWRGNPARALLEARPGKGTEDK